MKANAPEKIWLDSRSVFLSKPNKSGLTEYTRTDAFIEKACRFIKEHHHEFSFWNTEEYELGLAHKSLLKTSKLI